MNYIDLRDLAKELSDFNDLCEDGDNMSALDDDKKARRDALLKLEKDLGGDLQVEAENEPTMIPDSEFEDYAQELAEDCCEMPRDLKWPFTCIDWKQAAAELQHDYTSIDFDGETYWRRS